MTIDPRVGMWVSIIAMVVSGLIACGAEFTDIFGPDTSKKILGVLGLVNAVINGINAALHAIPSSKPDTQADAAKFALGPTAK